MRRLRVAGAGLIIGVTIALGSMPADRLHAINLLLLAWLALHWAAIVPWLLAALFGRLWWKVRQRMSLYEQMAVNGLEEEHRLRADLWNHKRALEAAQQRRKRATR